MQFHPNKFLLQLVVITETTPKSVDFPAPFAPINAVILFSWIVKFTFSKTLKSPYACDIFFNFDHALFSFKTK